jgi:hypothetical protein
MNGGEADKEEEGHSWLPSCKRKSENLDGLVRTPRAERAVKESGCCRLYP